MKKQIFLLASFIMMIFNTLNAQHQSSHPRVSFSLFCEKIQRQFEIDTKINQYNDTIFVYINDNKLGFVSLIPLSHGAERPETIKLIFYHYRSLYDCEEIYIKDLLVSNSNLISNLPVLGISFKKYNEFFLKNTELSENTTGRYLYEAGIYNNRSNNYMIAALGVGIVGSIISSNLNISGKYTSTSYMNTGFIITGISASTLSILSLFNSYKSNERLKQAGYIYHLNKQSK